MIKQVTFKVGDEVRVKNGSAEPRNGLTEGTVHTVTKVGEYLCKVTGSNFWWYANRFEAVPVVSPEAKQNSVEALRKVDIGGVHQKILDCLRLFPGRRASSTEIEKASKLKAHKRMPELERLGFVKRDGKTKVDGRNVTVWGAIA